MASNMKNFLIKYYRQMNFNDMPAETRARFDEFSSRNDFNGNMGKWKSDLTNPISGTNNPLPDANDPTEMDQAEWEKLFTAFHAGFIKMNANKEDFEENKKANSFLSEYFGPTQLFSASKVNNTVKSQIDNLIFMLETDTNLEMIAQGVFTNRAEFTKFLVDIKAEKYNSIEEVKTKLQKVAAQIYNADNISEPIKSQMVDIYNGFDDLGPINPNKLSYFKNEFPSLLHTLYNEKNVREVFEKYDEEKITGPLKTAIEKTDYRNKESKDYIPPKRIDELTLGQQISKWRGDTFQDYLKKYTNLKGDRLLFKEEVGFVLKAFDHVKTADGANGIKPTDGLEKILAEKDKILAGLQYKSPKAVKSFEYFVTVMTEMQDTMPKAFNGALQNGRQLKVLVEEIAMHAIDNGKVEEAKAVMEILSVIKYGYTTSKIMDAIDKEKLTIFSDKSLTWNSNAGMQFVTNAMDRSIKAAIQITGRGIAMAGNAVLLSGSKFNGKSARMAAGEAMWNAENETARGANISQRNTDVTRLGAPTTIMSNINTDHGINTTNIDAHNTAHRTARTDEATSLTEFQTANALFDSNNQDIVQLNSDINDLNTEIAQLNIKRTTLNTEISTLETTLNNANTYTGIPDPAANAMANNLGQKIQAKKDELKLTMDTISVKETELTNKTAAHTTALANVAPYQADMNTKETAHTTRNTANDAKEATLQEWSDANEQVNFLNNAITNRNNTLSTWDDDKKNKYHELMAHWDYLETGKHNKSHALGSKKKKQTKYDINKKEEVLDFYADYGRQAA